jgi:hypothetical protein
VLKHAAVRIAANRMHWSSGFDRPTVNTSLTSPLSPDQPAGSLDLQPGWHSSLV